MQYRLRTLLIAMAVGCILLACIAWIRRSRDFHRRELWRLAGLIAVKSPHNQESVNEILAEFCQGRSVTNWVQAVKGDGLRIIALENGGHLWVTFWDINVNECAVAVHHAMLADRHDRALTRPWILICESVPPMRPAYVSFEENNIWGDYLDGLRELKPE